MKLDDDKIDDSVLALLWLGLHDEIRAWKNFDWATMERLHAKGFIDNPRGKTKSVIFTEAGLARSQELLQLLFSTDAKDVATQTTDPSPM